MLIAVLAMFIAWVIYFHIQDKKEEQEKQLK